MLFFWSGIPEEMVKLLWGVYIKQKVSLCAKDCSRIPTTFNICVYLIISDASKKLLMYLGYLGTQTQMQIPKCGY